MLQLPAIKGIKVKMALPERVNLFRAKKNTLPAAKVANSKNKTVPSRLSMRYSGTQGKMKPDFLFRKIASMAEAGHTG